MKHYTRVFGWLLLGMGTVLSALTLLAATGLFPLQIDFFGLDLEASGERITCTVAWLLVAIIGLGLLVFGRRKSA